MSRQPFNTRWAQNVETDVPADQTSTVYQDPGDRLASGWKGGQDQDAPPAGQENWWHNRVDSALQDIERGGVMSYSAGAIYAAGAPTKGSDANYYESINNSNVGNDPVSTSGYWRLLGPSLYSLVPVGAVIAVAHSGVPDAGWLKLNGSVLTRSSYLRLFNKIGTSWNTGGESSLQFRLPDFRGEFLRGFDEGRGVDPGRTFASTQQWTVGPHVHDITKQDGAAPGKGFSTLYNSGVTTPGTTFMLSSGSGIGTENRPRNVSVNYWIKY